MVIAVQDTQTPQSLKSEKKMKCRKEFNITYNVTNLNVLLNLIKADMCVGQKLHLERMKIYRSVGIFNFFYNDLEILVDG